MNRDDKGRYGKGFCGNPKGRPRKQKRAFTNRQLRCDILLTMEEELVVPIDGKRTKMPAVLLIHKQLVRKAVLGDVRCIFKAIELRRQLIAEIVEERLALMQELLENQQMYKESPENFTDQMLALMQEARELIADEHTLH